MNKQIFYDNNIINNNGKGSEVNERFDGSNIFFLYIFLHGMDSGKYILLKH